MDEIKAKQQVVEKIQASSKILVTVSDDPSVDALSAALGLAMILDKQEKYATAIFSGHTPPAIAFLEPEKTFDDTTDSLRDFIIALNKEKADHLRYKVEGDSVKIFITPYKTTISEDDLIFSQGDYNVELVIALGVDNKNSLDGALANHGQILHDAAIITMTAGDQTSDLGGIDWHDSNSSSLSEMVAGLAEALKDDKKKPLLDETIATALLTGIVAETDRFSNEHTTSKAMTVAANLMAAGADQQLIANELQNANLGPNLEGDEDPDATASAVDATSGVGDTSGGGQDGTQPTNAKSTDGIMDIRQSGLDVAHGGETLAELDKRVRGKGKSDEKAHDHPHKKHKKEPEKESESESEPRIEQAQDIQHSEEKSEPIEPNEPVGEAVISHAYLSEPSEPNELSEPVATPGSVSVNDVSSEQHTMSHQPPSPADLGLPLPPPLPDFSNGAPSLPDFTHISPPPAIPLPTSNEQPAILGDILSSDQPGATNQSPISDQALNAIPAPNSAYAYAPPEEPQPESQPQAQSQPIETVSQPQASSQAIPSSPTATPASPVNPGQFQIPTQQ